MPRPLLFAVGVVALSAAGGTAVTAADMPRKAPPAAAPVWTWDGVYLGAHAGYAWTHDPVQNPLFAGQSTPSVGDINAQGAVAGFQFGANWQRDRWLGGLELDISATTARASSSAAGAGPIPGVGAGTGSLTLGDQVDMLSSGRVRFGYLPRPDLLLYATGGLAWTRVDESSNQVQTVAAGTTTTTLTFPSWQFGWVAGAGAEMRLANTDWLARLEYLHYDFGDAANSTQTTILNGAAFTSVSSSGPVTIDLVRAGLSYKFGGGGSAAGWAGAGPYAWAPPAEASLPWTWSGFYVGAHAGYGWTRDRIDEFFGDGIMHGINGQGGLGGVQAGADWQSGRLVGGLEIDVTATDIHGQNSGAGTTTVPFVTSQSGTFREEFHLLGSARTRIGYLISPTTLLYGTGGLAWTEIQESADGSSTSTIPGVPPTTTQSIQSSSAPSWRFGWVAGLGAEQRIGASNWTARLEYLHYDFGATETLISTVTTGGVTTVTPLITSDHLTADVVRAGASYRLGGDGGTAPTRVSEAAAPTSWNGFYLGVHGGGGFGNDPFSISGPTPAVPNIHSSGWLAGGHAGANWQTGRWLAGAEIDISATGIKGSSAATLEIVPGASQSEAISDSIELLGSARARLGWLPWPNLMVYGTGGLAWTDFQQGITFGSSGFGTVSTLVETVDWWRWGWVAGLGAEARIGHGNWLARVEYLHYDFGKGIAQSIATDTSATVVGEGALTTDVVRAGLSYQLN